MRKRKMWAGYLFILPSFIGVLIFVLVPYIDVVQRAFVQTVSGRFVGISNFLHVFQNKAFLLAMTNTGRFVGVCIPILLLLSLAIGVFLAKQTASTAFLKQGFLVPMAIPVVSVVILWQFLFDKHGFLNGVLHLFGASGVDWMNSSYAFYVLVFSYIWKNLGYCIVLWMAGIAMIPNEIYEAAKVDGAGEWQCFVRITLPNLKGTCLTVCILSIINSFKVFREAYLVAGDYPNRSMYMLQHLFNNWFRDLDLDKMAAGAVSLSVIMVLLILGLWKLGGRQE